MNAGRAASLLLLFLLAAAPAVWTWQTVRARETVGTERRALELTLDDLDAKLSAIGGGAARSADSDEGALLLGGPTAALAGAELQRRVADIVSEAGASLDEFEFLALPDGIEEEGGEVQLRLGLASSTPVLQRIIYEIEQSRPAITIRALRVEGVAAGRRDSRDAAELNVTILVEGYWRRRT